MGYEDARKRLQDLTAVVKEKVSPTGEPLLHREGLKMIERLSRDLGAPGGMPGLNLFRDAPAKFRLRRSLRNAELVVEWQRDIGAMVVTGEKTDGTKKFTRYVFDPEQGQFRRMEGEGELYNDLVDALVEYLYPEGRTHE